MNKEKGEVIKPELLGGFQDFLPETMIPRQKIISIIQVTFERFGFLPMETPGLERSSVLGTDKDEFKMEVYKFKAGDQDVTLRFDLTVPLSRVIAAHPELLKPFKRYQRGSVWRKERPQAGRYREFMQFDADIVGSDSILADIEIIWLMYSTMKNLGIDNFVVRFNNRKILNGLPAVIGFPEERAKDVFRVLDKLDKIGLVGVIDELQQKSDGEYGENPLNLPNKCIEKIKEFIAISGNSQEVLSRAREFFKGIRVAEEGLEECREIMDKLKLLEIPEKNWKFDLSIARGLGYYTGPVFETTLDDIPEIGSVFSGGRFDELVMRYTGEKIPAVGASVGVDRLISALDRLEKIKKIKSISRVMISVIDDRYIGDILGLAKYLREKGINSEIYMGKEKGIKPQLIYAAKREIPFLIIFGEEEKSKGLWKLKDMTERKEYLLTKEELLARLGTKENKF